MQLLESSKNSQELHTDCCWKKARSCISSLWMIPDTCILITITSIQKNNLPWRLGTFFNRLENKNVLWNMYSLNYIDIINFVLFYSLSLILKVILAQSHETRTLIWLMSSTLPNPGLDKYSTYHHCRNRR